MVQLFGRFGYDAVGGESGNQAATSSSEKGPRALNCRQPSTIFSFPSSIVDNPARIEPDESEGLLRGKSAGAAFVRLGIKLAGGKSILASLQVCAIMSV
jgi:hypothetical protein